MTSNNRMAVNIEPEAEHLQPWAHLRQWEAQSGWRIASPRHYAHIPCLLWLDKRRHPGGLTYCDCPMQVPPHRWPIWDHVRRATSPDGHRAILLAPYWFTGQDARRLTDWCDARGLVWACNGFTTYLPMRSVLLALQRPARPFDRLPWPDGGGTDGAPGWRESMPEPAA